MIRVYLYTELNTWYVAHTACTSEGSSTLSAPHSVAHSDADDKSEHHEAQVPSKLVQYMVERTSISLNCRLRLNFLGPTLGFLNITGPGPHPTDEETATLAMRAACCTPHC